MGNRTQREGGGRALFIFFNIQGGEGDRHVLIMEYFIMKYLHVHVYTSRNGNSILAYLIKLIIPNWPLYDFVIKQYK